MSQHPLVIHLRLERPQDMFELPHADVLSEDRNFQSGIDYCLSELRGRMLPEAVRLELELPASDADDATRERVQRTLRRYCQQRMLHNSRERRAAGLNGLSSLRVGLPVAIFGLLISLAGAKLLHITGNTAIVLDTVGWVFVWVGLWFPLDTLLFTPLVYGRENRVLARLLEAHVILVVAGTEPSNPRSIDTAIGTGLRLPDHRPRVARWPQRRASYLGQRSTLPPD